MAYNPRHRPDYNPDREGHRDHKFIVQDATRRKLKHVPGSPQLKFNKEGRCLIKDKGLAREIQNETRDVAVTRVNYPSRSDRGHVYFFGQMPAMPWHRYDKDGNRIDE